MPSLVWTAGLLLLAASLSKPNVAAAPSAGCGRTPTLKADANSTMVVGNKTREFIVRLPEAYDNTRPYRLVFTFHALAGNATQTAQGGYGTGPYYGLAALADASAVFVSPNGQPETNASARVNGLMGWANRGGEDVRFVDALAERLLGDLCIDTSLVFATGFSYGAAMSYALVCARPQAFRAVALLSGGTMSGCEGGQPRAPLAYYEQHGARDRVLDIATARTMRDAMVKLNGCKPVDPEPVAPAGGHTRVVYEGCDPRYPLTWTVFDGDHTSSPKNNGSATTFSPAYTWEFLSQFK